MASTFTNSVRAPNSPAKLAPQTASKSFHFERVDALRGLAILGVFLYHYWLAVSKGPLSEMAHLGRLASPLLWPHQFGMLGVKLFFVISGFCIHGSFLNWQKRNPSESLKNYWKTFAHRRFWRIIPPYLLALLAFYIMQYKGTAFDFKSIRHLLIHASLIQIFNPAFEFNINPSFWSIAVECHLYMIYPLFLMMVLRRSLLTAFMVASAISIFFHLGLPLLTSSFGPQQLPFSWWYDWTIGACVAQAFAEKRRLFGKFSFVLGCLSIVVGAVSFRFGIHLLLTWIAPPLGFAMILEASLWSARPLNLVERWLSALGLCSYSFYLIHQPLVGVYVAALPHFGGLNTFSVWILYCTPLFAALCTLSYTFYHWLEIGSVKLGDKIWEVLKPVDPREGTVCKAGSPNLTASAGATVVSPRPTEPAGT